MRVAWVTDVHLNFLNEDERADAFFGKIIATKADALLVTGDIAEGPSLLSALTLLRTRVQMPVWYVLGNHDFYDSSIEDVRASVASDPGYLSNVDVYKSLSKDTVLIGTDGWGDARNGLVTEASMLLADFVYVAELKESHPMVPVWYSVMSMVSRYNELLERKKLKGDTDAMNLLVGMSNLARGLEERSWPSLKAALNKLGLDSAKVLRTKLDLVVKIPGLKRIVVATHVPPFREASWHAGKPGDDNGVPHFSCGATGAVLKQFAQDHPELQIEVYCGHTHSAAEVSVLGNLKVFVGLARYGHPAVQPRLIEA